MEGALSSACGLPSAEATEEALAKGDKQLSGLVLLPKQEGSCGGNGRPVGIHSFRSRLAEGGETTPLYLVHSTEQAQNLLFDRGSPYRLPSYEEITFLLADEASKSAVLGAYAALRLQKKGTQVFRENASGALERLRNSTGSPATSQRALARMPPCVRWNFDVHWKAEVSPRVDGPALTWSVAARSEDSAAQFFFDFCCAARRIFDALDCSPSPPELRQRRMSSEAGMLPNSACSGERRIDSSDPEDPILAYYYEVLAKTPATSTTTGP